ncbi:MAG: hypothetical protein LUD72_11630, partial [Bacteroidales bacterium]|nr:hypothetical protein [Bacteroidales bacterium]
NPTKDYVSFAISNRNLFVDYYNSALFQCGKTGKILLRTRAIPFRNGDVRSPDFRGTKRIHNFDDKIIHFDLFPPRGIPGPGDKSTPGDTWQGQDSRKRTWP